MTAPGKTLECRVQPNARMIWAAPVAAEAIRLSARPVVGGVELKVSDAGPGVPAPLRDQVFERFMTAGNGPTRTNRGLGLAFCKAAVEAHGGRIWVEDAAPGAAFCMRLGDAA